MLPALVQRAKAFANTTNSALTAALTAAPANGDLLVMIGAAEHGGLSSVTGGGATWTRATRSLSNTNMEIWYGVTNGSSAIVTITFPAFTLPIWMIVTDWSGMASTSVSDGAGSTAGNTSPAAAGTPVSVAAGDLLIFGAADQTPNTFGNPAPGAWTVIDSVTSNATTETAWFEIAPSAGSYAPTVSETSHNWDAALAGFRAAP